MLWLCYTDAINASLICMFALKETTMDEVSMKWLISPLIWHWIKLLSLWSITELQTVTHAGPRCLHCTVECINSPQNHLGRAASPPFTAENGLARCVCCYLCNTHCKRVQSLSRRYATSTPHRLTQDDGIYRASIASRDENTPNSILADIYRIKQAVRPINPVPPK